MKDNKTNKDIKVKKIALLGMFCALSVSVSFIETLIPPIVPVPGVKPGFSNIVTMFATASLGAPYGLAVTLFKAFFALITRGVTASIMSLCGGLFSLLVMIILLKVNEKIIGYIGIGVLCAVAHNMGQLTVAVVILGKAILYIAPVLIISGVICGGLTGTIFRYTFPLLHRHTKQLSNRFLPGNEKG